MLRQLSYAVVSDGVTEPTHQELLGTCSGVRKNRAEYRRPNADGVWKTVSERIEAIV